MGGKRSWVADAQPESGSAILSWICTFIFKVASD